MKCVRRSRRGFAGLDQVNVLAPRDLIGQGEVPLLLTVDGQQANSVTVDSSNGCSRRDSFEELILAPVPEAIVIAVALIAEAGPVGAGVGNKPLLGTFVFPPLSALVGAASIIATIVAVAAIVNKTATVAGAITVVVSNIITIPRGRRLRKCDR
jgi:hypothetical protein